MPFLGGRGQASRGYFGGGTTPGAPTALVSTRGNGQISVAFTAPSFDGGLPITTYQYALSTDSYATFTTRSAGTTASPLVITGLTNGTSYGVKIRAVNSLGAGIASDAATAVTPATVPGAPGTPTATTCQNTQSALSWTAAASNGSAVTDYVVEYSTSATFASAVTVFADGTSASTTATVTGLTNGTTYYFRVKATNAVGTGTYSGISTATTPATVPGAPTSVVGTSNANGQSSVSWVAPASNGGDAVASYTVEYSTSATFASAVTVVSPVSTSSPKVVTGLTNGTTYYFRVKATNCAGSSSYSTISAGAVPSTVPNAPTITSSPSNINGQVTVSWNALTGADTGGASITSYTLQHSASSTFASGVVTVTGIASTSHTVSGLTNGTTRYFKVLGVNASGPGAYSATASGTPSTVPGTPTNVQGTANGVTSSTVTWTAPAAANTGPNFTDITGYKVEYALSPYSSYTEFTANTGNTNTSISVTGLTNGESYRFKVTARNVPNGLGTTSTPSDVVVTNIVPGAPTIGTMTRGTGGSTTDSLVWTAPAANGGSAVTGYVYAVSTDSYAAATATTNGLTASQTFNPGYTTATTTVKIAAVNSLGTGPYSEASAVGYGGWANPSYSINDQVGCPDCAACSCPACPACACGTSTSSGSAVQTGSKGTRSKTCYQWTRAGNDTAGPYDQGGTSACTAAFGACAGSTCNCSSSGPSGGTCACSACGTNENYINTYNPNVLYSSNRGYNFYFEVLSGTYVWGSGTSGQIGCNSGSGLAGPSVITRCDATGVFTTNDGITVADACNIVYCC